MFLNRSAGAVQRNAKCTTTRVFSDAGLASTPSALQIHLYQYAICPFCHRVKAVLDYSGVDYKTTEVNPLTKAEIKPWKDQHTKVPIATISSSTDGDNSPKPLFESAAIVEGMLAQPVVQKRLTNRWETTRSNMTVDQFQNGPHVQKWTDFAVNDLATLLYPNMCGSWSDSYKAFNYVDSVKTFGVIERIMIQSVGSLAMFMAASRIKKKRNITDEVKALDNVLEILEAELSSNTFLSRREEPDLGDLTVFGTLRAIDGLPVHKKLLVDRGGPIEHWYKRMGCQMDTTAKSSN